MSDKSKIEWTDATWNPVRGCSRVSAGCTRCYAERMAARFSGPGGWAEGLAENTPAGPRWTGRVELVPEKLDQPLRWKRPRRVFVNSMSDLFHEGLSNADIAAVFGVMAASPQHTFQVLTKRPERMREWFRWAERMAIPGVKRRCVAAWECVGRCADLAGAFDGPKRRRLNLPGGDLYAWPLPNVWLGVSVEDQATADARIPLLLNTPAAVRFVSAEPLLGPVDMRRGIYQMSDDVRRGTGTSLVGIDWVIVGGESGPGARPMHPDWARSLRDQCEAAGVAYFMKQMGAVLGVELGCADRAGHDMDKWPVGMRVREFPHAQG